ncbi:oxidoreductase [Amycolatopsis antarctica]|uniref:Oxidoreductase n=2 Tax=Amycolatopsis antarctica TaxID=1854586 RepID=A0A263D4J1_9PSEU|nr:oxidoreductase [Amycolatopsis antarctica]
MRLVAGHDLTVAIAHGKSFLGSASVWVGGNDEQAAWLGAQLAGGTEISWGLTERGHGSDLLAGALSATRDGGRWRLDGEKWLINNATRADLICVLARTDPAGGPRGFSLFLVDKRTLPEDTFRCLPRERTHGIRGADISGISFTAAPVPATALVGAEGTGLETVLTALQLTRTVCGALSLGAADHALRLTADFLRERQVYGQTLAELPNVRHLLGRAAAGTLVAEAVMTVTARGVHTLPGELSVGSAVTKAFVPTVVDGALEQLGELLGARGFLTGAHADGMFAKLERDHRVVGIFDGSTPVNRSALIAQFPRLARTYRRPDALDGAAAAANLGTPLPPLDPKALKLVSGTGCGIVRALPDAARHARDRAAADPADRNLAAVAALATAIEDEAAELHTEIAAGMGATREVPAAAFLAAERYELCYAASACLLLWWHNPESTEPEWARACLSFVAEELALEVNLADNTDVSDSTGYEVIAAAVLETSTIGGPRPWGGGGHAG